MRKRPPRSRRSVLLLTGDHGYALFDEFRRACPDQYINAGVAEQNMVGVAAGLAKGGLRPVVYGLSASSGARPGTNQAGRLLRSLPVLFIGDGAGVVYSAPGHQPSEHRRHGRAAPVPHLTILSPADGRR